MFEMLIQIVDLLPALDLQLFCAILELALRLFLPLFQFLCLRFEDLQLLVVFLHILFHFSKMTFFQGIVGNHLVLELRFQLVRLQ